jgi:hypothetical protein
MSAMVVRGGGGDGSTREAAELGEFGGGAMSSCREAKSSALAVKTAVRSRFFYRVQVGGNRLCIKNFIPFLIFKIKI